MVVMKKCPVCEKGSLKKGEVEEEMFGVKLGRFPAEVCTSCGESFVDDAAVQKIEARAKELGIWGLAKKVKVVRSGNSLAVRIPAELAKFLSIAKDREVLLYPEGKRKLVFEVT